MNIEAYNLIIDKIKPLLDGRGFKTVDTETGSYFENGEIAAVLVDDEATLKRVYLNDNTLTLVACNSKYQPFVFTGEQLDKIIILGKAVGFTSFLI